MAESLSLDAFLGDLTAAFGDKARRNEPLAGHTTPRIGGPADVWLAAGTLAELIRAVGLARQHQIPVFMLGGGANVLIRDAGIRGLVLENRAGRVEFPPPQERAPGEMVSLTAESGVVIPSLVRRCAKRGLSGLEWAVGVPGTMGGAVVNNAGAYGRDMRQSLVRAELLASTGERVWQPVTWFAYEYRGSRLKRGHRLVETAEPEADWVVLQAEIAVTRAPVADVQTRLAGFNERRKASQPPGASMGSMFKNPPGDYAGRLIEAAGLKGYRLGQAQISPVHANFFRNLGGATAAEMLALIDTVQDTVRQKYGIELELEIEIVGD